ncbi:hypothetical protein BDN67DRAFT_1017870 [Paxillus ammoniavirescens]|nr:hypothetical protein BDN67DRAFT_1017870 [Paxillus ammoniavirescens]
MKSQNSADTIKQSFIEVAGKVTQILYAQDGRHSVPVLRILDTKIMLSFFDRGGSVLTASFDIHERPEMFLRILIGISFSPPPKIGFDQTIIPHDDKTKQILVTWKEKIGEDKRKVIVDCVIFISDSLHSRGTTVWGGTVSSVDNPEPQPTVVKDSWVDPLRRYTEGAILAMLNAVGVEGVPYFVHEQQVPITHPSRDTSVNASTHFLHTVFSDIPTSQPYHLRVLSRLISQPIGEQLMKICCLAELVVAIIDCVLSHKDAIEKANVYHRNISLLNLLLVAWDMKNCCVDFLEMFPIEERKRLLPKIRNLPHHGFLANWGYAVPLHIHDQAKPPVTVPKAPLEHGTGHRSTSPISFTDDEMTTQSLDDLERVDSVLIHSTLADGSISLKYVPTTLLGSCDNITLPMAGDPLPDESRPSVDTSPLYRMGTWAWMAAKLVKAGPGQPVSHTVMHNLESFFYVLLGFCVLYDEPYKHKPEPQIVACFDIFFNTSEPSLNKTINIQSQLGWSTRILPFISPYYKPLIPLLEMLREKIVLPMSFSDDKVHSGNITHNEIMQGLLDVLHSLGDSHWIAREHHTSKSIPSNKYVVNNLVSIEELSDEDFSDSTTEPESPPRIEQTSPIRELSGPGFSSSSGSY